MRQGPGQEGERPLTTVEGIRVYADAVHGIAEDDSVKLMAMEASTLYTVLDTLLRRIAELEGQVRVPLGTPLHKRVRRGRMDTVGGE